MNVANIADLRAIARRKLPGPIFDLIDGGAFDERTLTANVADYGAWRFRQRVGCDVGERDLSTTIVGRPVAMPVAIAPTGLSGILPAGGNGEVQAARAAHAAGIPYTLGMMAFASIEALAELGGETWFQVCMLKDRALIRGMIERARAVGVEVLILTMTMSVMSQSNRSVRNPAAMLPPKMSLSTLLAYGRRPRWSLPNLLRGVPAFPNFTPHVGAAGDLGFIVGQMDPTTTWRDVAWLRDLWPGKLIVKGVMAADDVEQAVSVGADAISVSNHGGNQLDGGSSTIRALPEIVTAAAGRVEVLVDGGIRSGQDVLKALALGARAGLIGRAHLYGLAADGEAGVAQSLAIIRRELDVTTGLVGLDAVRAATPAILIPA